MNNERKVRNPIAVALAKRHGATNTTHRHRTARRAKDSRNSWQRDWRG